MATADLLLHPVRIRVLQVLFDSDAMTTAQLRDRLPDIAPATMYRHIAVLAEAGVLEVVSEKRVRGTVERSYRVHPKHAVVAPEARAVMTRDDHQRAFTTFAVSLMSDFDRYVTREDADPVADGVVYRQAGVWLNDDEFAAMVEEIEAAVVSRTGTTGGEGRTRRIVSLVVVPDKLATESAADTDAEPEAG